MKKGMQFKIVVGNLKEGSNNLKWLIKSEELEIEDILFIGDIKVLMDIIKSGYKLLIFGRMTFLATLTCAYCGEEFQKVIEEEFTSTYIKGDWRKLPPKLDLTDEEIDRVYYSGEMIDLLPLLRDTIILSIPIAPQCGKHSSLR